MDGHIAGPPITSADQKEDVQYENNLVSEKNLVQEDHLTLVSGDLAESRARFTYDDATRLKRKADRRILPLLVFAYLVKNIDNNLASVCRENLQWLTVAIVPEANEHRSSHKYPQAAENDTRRLRTDFDLLHDRLRDWRGALKSAHQVEHTPCRRLWLDAAWYLLS